MANKSRIASKRDERRRATREPAVVALDVSEPNGDTDDSALNHNERGHGRTRNISETGVCFLSSMRLRPGLISVREAGGAGAEVDLEIVRAKKVNDGLWEYGAAICSGGDAAAYELSSEEFQRLAAEVGRDHQLNSGAADDGRAEARQLVLSLREVVSRQADLEKYTESLQRQRTAVSTVKAFVMFTAVLVIAQNVWDGESELWWAPALAGMLVLMYVTEWLLERRVRNTLSDSADVGQLCSSP